MKTLSLLRSLLFVACPAGLFGAPAAHAVVVTFEFAGEVDDLTADLGLFGFAANVGDPFTGRFSYETDASNPDLAPADPNLGAYQLLTFEIDQADVSLSPLSVSVTRTPPMVTLPPLPPDPGSDWLRVRATAPGYPAPVGLSLEAPFASVFASDALPTALDLEDFTLGAGVQGLVAIGIPPAPSIVDAGTLTSIAVVVPEPAALPWFAMGLLLVVRRRR